MRARHAVLALVALVAAACGTERDARAAGTTTKPVAARTSHDSTETIAWPDFALSVPVGTRRKVSEQCPGGRLVGPAATDSSGQTRPTFDLCVETHDKRADQPLSAWLDSARAERNRTLDEELAQLAPPDSLVVGTRVMLRLEPYCGDCEAFEYYDAAGARVASFSFALGEHLAGNRDAQEAAHLAVLRSLRWLSPQRR